MPDEGRYVIFQSFFKAVRTEGFINRGVSTDHISIFVSFGGLFTPSYIILALQILPQNLCYPSQASKSGDPCGKLVHRLLLQRLSPGVLAAWCPTTRSLEQGRAGSGSALFQRREYLM